MSRVRVVFLGTPEFAVACLERMINDDHFEIVGVISQPDRPAGRKMQMKASPVKELALKHGLNVFTPESVNKQEFRDQIAALGAESAAVVAFGQILGQKFLDLFRHGCVNVHGSLLPRWRGAAPIQRALMAGDTKGGVSLQVVVRALDAGPVLGERTFEIDHEINALELHDKLKELGADLLHVEYMDYLRGQLRPRVQDESGVTYAHKLEKADAKLNFEISAWDFHNRVRGLAMGPSAYIVRPDAAGAGPKVGANADAGAEAGASAGANEGSGAVELAGAPLKIHKTRVVSKTESHARAGQVLAVTPNSFTVQCTPGVIEILEVQPESRARQSVSDYLRGYPLAVHDQL